MAKYDDKVLFYCTTDDVCDLDEAVTVLRRNGVKVDRGAVVRAAISLTLPDLLADAKQSSIYRQLSGASATDSGIPDPALFA